MIALTSGEPETDIVLFCFICAPNSLLLLAISDVQTTVSDF